MENIKERLIKANSILNNKLKLLEKLETEKKDIIQRFENSNDKVANIEQEMKSSEKKFIALSDEISVLLKKIKQLKKMFINISNLEIDK